MSVAVLETGKLHQAAPASAAAKSKFDLYYLLFFLSGFPALLYQIVWQRTLFTLFGVNVESVTVVVTVFMLGLGLGSVAGGRLSARPGARLLLAFGTIEISIGAFGFASLWIFHRVAAFTAGASLTTTGLIAFALLLIPTLLMGSTLPLLVEHFVRRTGNVGESVGLLYCVNTFGSGAACICAAVFLMRSLGQTGSVRLAVCFNVVVGVTALILQFAHATLGVDRKQEDAEAVPQQVIPLWIGLLLAGGTGFIALAYEIIWYRLYAYTSGGTAPCFALLLGAYLFGIAYASLAVRDACRKRLGSDLHRTLAVTAQVVLFGAIASYLLGPALSHWVTFLHWNVSLVMVFIAAGLLGAAFPLLSHATIDPRGKVGNGISLLYLSNIIGSALGSFLVGFILMDYWTTRATSVLLLVLGLLVSLALWYLSGMKGRKVVFASACVVALILAIASRPLYAGMYERLLSKSGYAPSVQFSEQVENRSGVISVLPSSLGVGYPTSIVFGGGIYDGRFNTDLMHDSNGLFRTFAIAGIHPNPKHVLMIGLSSGSWAQVVVSNPKVEDMTIVEINPGYLPLIRNHAEVASVLTNPKVHVVIDDGRRWLVGHRNEHFDLIVMNTTFNWRANISNLLSAEFLALARAHLNSGGILYYNTTWSKDVLKTGATLFPHALRVDSFLAVSDSEFSLDKDRWRAALSAYRIDGNPVLNLANPAAKAKLEELLHMADSADAGGKTESRENLLKETQASRIITDDNMGTEWP
jgi:spermidine synthase